MEVSHKEFVTVLKGKGKYEKLKGNVRIVRSKKLEEKNENMRFDSVNSKKTSL